MLVTFVLFGHWMEMKSRSGTTDALRALFDLVPPTATVIRAGQEVEVPTAEIVVSDLIRLRPGEKVPVDGVVREGETSIDESMVTGESVPVEKVPGNPVIGGSINRAGSVVVEATKVGSDTVLAQIVSFVQEAQSSKAPGQRLADRAAAYLVVLAVGPRRRDFPGLVFLGAGARDHGLDLCDLRCRHRVPGRAGTRDANRGGSRNRAGRQAQHPDQGRGDPRGHLRDSGDRAR